MKYVYSKKSAPLEISEDFKFLKPKEIHHLFILYLNGDNDAYQKIVDYYLNFVKIVAKNFEKYNISIEELIQEGNLAIFEAINTHEKVLPEVIGNYIVKTINEKMISYVLKQTKTNGLTIPEQARILEIKKLITDYENINGPLTDEEIANDLKIDLVEIKKIQNEKEIISFEDLKNNKYFLENETLLKEENNFEEDFFINERNKVIMDVINNLSERNREIIYQRFGFNDGKCRKLEEIAKDFNITDQAVRYVILRALRKIQHQLYKKNLVEEEELVRNMSTYHR